LVEDGQTLLFGLPQSWILSRRSLGIPHNTVAVGGDVD
jgi:hypothetical protein